MNWPEAVCCSVIVCGFFWFWVELIKEAVKCDRRDADAKIKHEELKIKSDPYKGEL